MNDEHEYALKWKIHDTLSRLGSSENTFTQVYVYEPETIKLNTDHYFIEQYNRQRAPQKKISRCLLASWNLDQNLGRIRNRRRHCSWTDTFFFSLILITIKNNSQFSCFLFTRTAFTATARHSLASLRTMGCPLETSQEKLGAQMNPTLNR